MSWDGVDRRAGESDLSPFDRRLSRLEATVEGLATNFANMADAMRQESQRTASQIERLTNVVSSQNKTPWGVLASWGAVFVTVIAVVGGLALTPLVVGLQKQEYRHDDLAEKLFEHHTDGHPGSIMDKVANNKAAIENLDEVLQREMRLLDDILQREMSLQRQVVEAQIGAISDRIKVNTDAIREISQEQRRRTERVYRPD